MRAIAGDERWRDGGVGERIVKQMVRELLLLESSDWPFLITTGAARDYAEMRFVTHLDMFHEIDRMWQEFVIAGHLREEPAARLREIESRDNIFPDVDPGLWAKRE